MIQVNPAHEAAVVQARRIADRAGSRSKIAIVTESGRRGKEEYAALDIDRYVYKKTTHVIMYVFGSEHKAAAISRLPILSERYKYVCWYCAKRFIIAPVGKCPYCVTKSGFGELPK